MSKYDATIQLEKDRIRAYDTQHNTRSIEARRALNRKIVKLNGGGSSVRFVKAPASSSKKLVAIFAPQPHKGWMREKRVGFGAKGYSDYTLHRDKERRQRYRNRHAKDLRVKDGRRDPRRPGFLSMFVLWGDSTSLEGSKADFKRRYDAMLKTGKPFDVSFRN